MKKIISIIMLSIIFINSIAPITSSASEVEGKVNSSFSGYGNIAWENKVGGWNNESFKKILIDPADGNYIAIGETNSGNDGELDQDYNVTGHSALIVKLDKSILDSQPASLEAGGSAQNPVIWENKLSGNNGNYFSDAMIDPIDGNVVVVGTTDNDVSGDLTQDNANGGRTDGLIVKIDSSTGNLIWENKVGGDGDDSFNTLEIGIDGNYIVGGTTTSTKSGELNQQEQDSLFKDSLAVKLDSAVLNNQPAEIAAGNTPQNPVIWENKMGKQNDDIKASVIDPNDSNIVMIGADSMGSGPGDFNQDIDFYNGGNTGLIFKLDSTTGQVIWENKISPENPAGGSTVFNDIIMDTDGNYLVVGATKGPKSGELNQDEGSPVERVQPLILKLSRQTLDNQPSVIAAGNTLENPVIWENKVTNSNEGVFTTVELTPDGNYIVGGYVNGKGGELNQDNYEHFGNEGIVVKLSKNTLDNQPSVIAAGNTPKDPVMWENKFNTHTGDWYTNEDNQVNDILIDSDGNYLIAGFACSDAQIELDQDNINGPGRDAKDGLVVKISEDAAISADNTFTVEEENSTVSGITTSEQLRQYLMDSFNVSATDILGNTITNPKADDRISVALTSSPVDANGLRPELTLTDIDSFHTPGTYNLTFQIIYSQGYGNQFVATKEVQLIVQNIVPTLSFDADADNIVNEANDNVYTVNENDPEITDYLSTYNVVIDNGDVIDATTNLSLSADTTTIHNTVVTSGNYTAPGNYPFNITVEDDYDNDSDGNNDVYTSTAYLVVLGAPAGMSATETIVDTDGTATAQPGETLTVNVAIDAGASNYNNIQITSTINDSNLDDNSVSNIQLTRNGTPETLIDNTPSNNKDIDYTVSNIIAGDILQFSFDVNVINPIDLLSANYPNIINSVQIQPDSVGAININTSANIVVDYDLPSVNGLQMSTSLLDINSDTTLTVANQNDILRFQTLITNNGSMNQSNVKLNIQSDFADIANNIFSVKIYTDTMLTNELPLSDYSINGNEITINTMNSSAEYYVVYQMQVESNWSLDQYITNNMSLTSDYISSAVTDVVNVEKNNTVTHTYTSYIDADDNMTININDSFDPLVNPNPMGYVVDETNTIVASEIPSVVSNAVDTSREGSYVVKYKYDNATYGTTATKEITVNVVNNSVHHTYTSYIDADDNMTININDSFDPLVNPNPMGYVVDETNTIVASEIPSVVSNAVDTSREGSYVVKYKYDNATYGTTATKEITVNVVGNTTGNNNNGNTNGNNNNENEVSVDGEESISKTGQYSIYIIVLVLIIISIIVFKNKYINKK